MEFSYDIVIFLYGIISGILGFFCGCIPESAKYQELKKKPLTYYELIKLPEGTKVLLLQYDWKEQGITDKEHGEIYIRKDGTKAVNVYDGDIDFTQADIWLDK